MYGLGDEIDGLREDVKLLTGIITSLLPYAPSHVKSLVALTLQKFNIKIEEPNAKS